MGLVLQMKVLPAFLHRSVQTEGGAEILQNIQVQIQAEEGEEDAEAGAPNQDTENLGAEVQRRQPAEDRDRDRDRASDFIAASPYVSISLLYCLYKCTSETS